MPLNYLGTLQEAEETASSIAHLANDLESVRKAFDALSTAQQRAELVKLNAEVAKLREEHVQTAYTIAKAAKGELRSVFKEVAPETRVVLEEVMDTVRAVKNGTVADWETVSQAISGTSGMHRDLRDKLILLIGKAQEMQTKGRNLKEVLKEIGNAANNEASDIAALGNTGAGLEGLDRMIGGLTDQLFLAREGRWPPAGRTNGGLESSSSGLLDAFQV